MNDSARQGIGALPTLLRLAIRHASAYPVKAVGIILVIFGAQSSVLFVPVYLGRMVDAFYSMNPTTTSVSWFFVWYVLPLILLRSMSWMLWRISGFLASDFQPRVMRDLFQVSFLAIMRQSYRFFSDSFTGSLVRRAKSIGHAFKDLTESFFWSLLPMSVSMIVGFVLLMSRSFVLGVLVLLWTLVLLCVNLLISRYKVKYDTMRAVKDAEVTGVLSDVITNAINVSLFTSRDLEEARFGKQIGDWRSLQSKAWRIGELGSLFQNIANILCEITSMFVAVGFWQSGRMTAGDIVFVQGILLVIFNNSHDLGRVLRRLYEAAADSKEMLDIMDAKVEVRDVRGAKPLRVRRGEIAFEDVGFSYLERRVLDSFTLSIDAHEKLAFVGSSGSGKSTVTKLLFRFFDPQQGRISIDGQDISKVTQESLRHAIAFVPQEPLLFHRSLKENIGYGKRDASDEEIVEAAKKAHCHEFISSLPDGYDTLVGERGIKLSGGERQRVAIARAILKNAPILVLDEATSSLDSESEALIQDALHELMRNKTVIVIAHRLSTIMQMDRIIVMEQGNVADMGTHDELLKKVGTYQKLWNIQAGGFQPV